MISHLEPLALINYAPTVEKLLLGPDGVLCHWEKLSTSRNRHFKDYRSCSHGVAAPVDPNAPLRGRYLQLRLEVVMVGDLPVSSTEHVRLAVQNAQLMAKPDDKGALVVWNSRDRVALQQPVAFFLPDTAADPSLLKPGEELWVKVSVPPNAMPRPIRLGIKKDGVLTPLNLR